MPRWNCRLDAQNNHRKMLSRTNCTFAQSMPAQELHEQELNLPETLTMAKVGGSILPGFNGSDTSGLAMVSAMLAVPDGCGLGRGG